MIKAEVIRSGTGWMKRFSQATIRRATVDTLQDMLPGIADEARRDCPASSWGKEHLRDTIGYGIDREKGYGYIKAGGTWAVWYAHLIERGFTDRSGRFHPGRRFMGNAVQAHAKEIITGFRSRLRRRLSSG